MKFVDAGQHQGVDSRSGPGEAGSAPVHCVVLERREVEPELQILWPFTCRDVELPGPPRCHLLTMNASMRTDLLLKSSSGFCS